MLVLSRKKGQAFYLDLGDGRQVAIQVLGRVGRATSIGIEAPRSVSITRAELRERESAAASAVPPPAEVSLISDCEVLGAADYV